MKKIAFSLFFVLMYSVAFSQTTKVDTVTVYPNPAQYELNIESSYIEQWDSDNSVSVQGDLLISNVVEDVVLVRKIKDSGGRIRVDISMLEEGLYYYSLRVYDNCRNTVVNAGSFYIRRNQN